jgi:GNAT superfamily N-acetyltransferase
MDLSGTGKGRNPLPLRDKALGFAPGCGTRCDAILPIAVTIRPAHSHEGRACRFLLRETIDRDRLSAVMVATLPPPDGAAAPHLLGAMALIKGQTPADAALSVLVHVAAPYRRQGIGRALIEAAIARCRGRTHLLRALRPVAAGSAAASFLAAAGFADYEAIVHYEADLDILHRLLQRFHERMTRRGAMPADIAILSLRQAPADKVAEMVASHLPITQQAVIARMRPGRADTYDLDKSIVLMRGAQCVGLIIGQWGEPVPSVLIRIVDPSLRGGWANILLLAEAVCMGRRARDFSRISR